MANKEEFIEFIDNIIKNADDQSIEKLKSIRNHPFLTGTVKKTDGELAKILFDMNEDNLEIIEFQVNKARAYWNDDKKLWSISTLRPFFDSLPETKAFCEANFG